MPFRITCVCLGNICRSPVAEAVLRQRIALAGLADEVVVDSAGTGGWHVGHDMDPRSRTVLDVHGYPHAHTARQFTAAWLGTGAADLLLAMDAANYDDLLALVRRAGSPASLRMLRSFDPELAHLVEPDPRLDLPDPYYGDAAGFDDMLSMIEKAADGLVGGLPGMLSER